MAYPPPNHPQQPPPNYGQQPPPNYGQPSQQQKGNIANPGEVAAKKHLLPRENLDNKINYQDDFLSHHLRYELSLTKLTSMKRIRRRQIFEHLWLQIYWGNMGGVKELDINFQGYQ